MRVTLTAVEAVSGERVDVLVELEPHDPVSTLEAALVPLLPPGRPGLWRGSRPLPPDEHVGTAGVLAGCVLTLGGPGPDVVLPSAGAVLQVVSGPGSGGLHALAEGEVVVGGQAPGGAPPPDGPAPSGGGGRVVVADPELARRHLHLQTSPAGVVATPLATTRLGGTELTGPTPVGAADLLAVGGSLLGVAAAAPPDAATEPGGDLTVVVNRPPRLAPATTVSTVELPAPPAAAEQRRLAVLPLVLPLLLGAVMAVLYNPLFLLFTLLSPLMALTTWWSDRRAGRRGAAAATRDHEAALASALADVARLSRAEVLARRQACPDAVEVLRTATGPGRRLWERRRGDADGLVLRVGTGPVEATSVRVTGPASEPRPAQPVLDDVPVVVPLREVGVLGVAGPADQGRALARWLVGQAAVLHGPRDLTVVLLVDPARADAERAWSWLRWLPHALPAQGQDCAALVGAGGDSPDALAARVAELGALVTARAEAARDVRGQLETRRQPDVLVVLDGARGLRGLPGLATVLAQGPQVGVHALCLDDQERLLPEECGAVARLDGSARLALRVAGEAEQPAVRAEGVSPEWAEQVARGLAPLRDGGADQAEGQVPDAARLLDVLGLHDLTPEAVRARMGRTTAAVVGLDADGPFALDLRRDGPHALVAGTTGAGKSELLQTLVASLAVANRPDAMTFVLVDYKGGAAFKDCARLPHTVGMVTDLDGHLVERALASLGAELRAREQVLAAAGAKDVEDLWRAGGALPRLVIVIDEFASLVEELPDFVKGLVGIAQRGRSLGVHLVLATQRPGGVVSPEIRANTNLRVALRVTDPAESLDVVDAPDAAAIARATPGRAYARTGHASLACFQAARVGGRAPGLATGPARPVRATRLPWSRVGDPLPPPDAAPAVEEDQTDLHALVLAVRQAADDLGCPAPRPPWLPPLPPSVTLADVRRELGPPERPGLPPVVFGLEDLPAEQARRPAVLDLEHGGHLLVAGGPRSGRSTLLRTLGTSLAATVAPSDAHLYALDCGNGSLLPLSELPHCGAVVLRTQAERADRLLTRLAGEVARRQELLAERGFADVAEQRAASADPLPYLVLLVDRWEGFTAAFEEVDAGRLPELLLRLLREGPGAGLRVVLTGDRSALSSRVASSVEDVLCLRLPDRSDYALAGLSPRSLPEAVAPGRAFRAATGTQVQVALLVGDDSGAAQSAAVGELAAHWRGRPVGGRRPFRVEVLPTRVTERDALALSSAEPRALRTSAGLGGDELAPQLVDLTTDGPGFTVAGPARSGRSTALLAMARGLLAGGTALCLLTPRPSPLRALAGTDGVLAVLGSADPDPAEVAAALNAATGPLAVLVDDAELLLAARVADLLQQVVRDGRDQGHALVLGGTTDELGASFRGFVADARRSRSGLLLSPASHLEGELLGVRLARSAAFTGPAGRGLLVRGGQVTLVQVPLPPEPGAS